MQNKTENAADCLLVYSITFKIIFTANKMADAQALTDFFNFVDTDFDGFITVNEIRNACAVDVNADGTIDVAEIDACSAPWTAKLSTQDLNGDQKLSLQELLSYNGINT